MDKRFPYIGTNARGVFLALRDGIYIYAIDDVLVLCSDLDGHDILAVSRCSISQAKKFVVSDSSEVFVLPYTKFLPGALVYSGVLELLNSYQEFASVPSIMLENYMTKLLGVNERINLPYILHSVDSITMWPKERDTLPDRLRVGVSIEGRVIGHLVFTENSVFFRYSFNGDLRDIYVGFTEHSKLSNSRVNEFEWVYTLWSRLVCLLLEDAGVHYTPSGFHLNSQIDVNCYACHEYNDGVPTKIACSFNEIAESIEDYLAICD